MIRTIDRREERPTVDDPPRRLSGPTVIARLADAAKGHIVVPSAPPPARRPLNLPLARPLRPDGPPLTEAQLWWAYSRTEVDE